MACFSGVLPIQGSFSEIFRLLLHCAGNWLWCKILPLRIPSKRLSRDVDPPVRFLNLGGFPGPGEIPPAFRLTYGSSPLGKTARSPCFQPPSVSLSFAKVHHFGIGTSPQQIPRQICPHTASGYVELSGRQSQLADHPEVPSCPAGRQAVGIAPPGAGQGAKRLSGACALGRGPAAGPAAACVV